MKALYRKRYFWSIVMLIISVILFASSFILKAYVVNNTSLKHQAVFFHDEINDRVADFNKTIEDTVLTSRLIHARESFNDVLFLFNKNYYFYIYKKVGDKKFLRFWNTSHVLPPDSILSNPKNEQFVKLLNGYYYVKRRPIPQNPELDAYCLVLIKSSFFVSTDYFRESFPFNRDLDKVVDLSTAPTPFVVKGSVDQPMFYLTLKPYAAINSDSVLSVSLRIFSLFFIFLSLYLLVYQVAGYRNNRLNLLGFVGAMFAFRLSLYLLKPYLNLDSFMLFDPEVYGSSFLLPTLGDLFINSLLFCWVGVFLWNRTATFGYKPHDPKTRTDWIVGFTSMLLLVSLTFLIANVIRSIISDSKISFDVTNFFSLHVIYTTIGFVILAFLSLGYFYFSQYLYRYIFAVFGRGKNTIYFVIVGTGLLLISLLVSRESVNFYLPCLTWLLFYTFMFDNERRIQALLKFNVAGIIFWIFVFSISISFLMLSEIRKSELSLRKLYTEKLATQTDPASERLINIANRYLDSNYFRANFERFYSQKTNQYLRDSIAEKNYIAYLNNYSTAIYLFDSLGRGLNNGSDLSLASLNTIVNRQSTPTSIPDLFYYETSFDKFAYITRRIVRDDSDKFIGSVFIVSNPKKFSGVNISPELFKQFRQWELSNSTVYYYAVYNNKLMTSSSKKYPFTSTLVASQIPRKRFDIRERDGYSELWYRPNENKVVVMARKSETVLETITLFSYLFCTFLILVAFIQGVTLLLGSSLLTKRVRRRFFLRPTIRGQIHRTFILITILSFLVVGIATISFFINRFESQNYERLGRTMNIMLNEMQTHKNLGSLIYEQRLSADSLNSNQLAEIIRKVSDIHGVDVNVYDYTGNLLASSQPDIYSKGVLSTQMGPRAYYSLLRLRKIEHIQKENISDLTYTSIYAPVRDDKGAFYGYLSIPYFTSQQQLNQEISDFLVTLINLIAFIFLITGMVALLITNRITRSFMIISDKMKQISLSKQNQQIEWNRDDEIGLLVAEYNKMVAKLHDSADEMARSEREDAWREMARQVAHEIKNPLTPMKLSLQYLQKAIKEDSPNTRQLTSSVAKTLVEQIDHLSKIAGDFSQFANINNAHFQVFDLHEVLYPLRDIYSKNPEVEFIMDTHKGPVNIMADKTQMNRLFTNLFVNAIEACEGNLKSTLKVVEKIEKHQVVISVSDNGSGIPQDVQYRIFTPYFTTKSSGTGLGLAMCKRIVEQVRGKIRFETEPGKGTAFIVSLPLAHG